MLGSAHQKSSEQHFAGKVVAVTGGARGIGKNIARLFGLQGARLAICDIDQEKGRTTQSELCLQGIEADFFQIDLSQRGVPQTMVRQIVQRHGRIDVLVNNARSGRRLGMLEENEDSWDEGMVVTLRAAFFASQEAIRAMKQTGGGRIVNISSVAARFACNESPAYHVAKAGLLQMTRYLAVYAGPYEVCVNAVLPGFIVQDEHRERYGRDDNRNYREIAEFCHPSGRVGESDDVANTILFLCSTEASFISGQCVVVDGGLTMQDQTGLVYRFYHNK